MSGHSPMLSREEACAMNINTPWEREYRARHFHVSEPELKQIVDQVGANAEAVTRFMEEKSLASMPTAPLDPDTDLGWTPTWESLRKR